MGSCSTRLRTSVWLFVIGLCGAFLAGCGKQHDAPLDPGAVRVLVYLDLAGEAEQAHHLTGSGESLPSTVAPAGLPTDPSGSSGWVTEIELFVYREGELLSFDADGNVVESGGVPVWLTSDSVTLNLQHGTYEFVVSARDEFANELAASERDSVTITTGTTVSIRLLSRVGGTALSGPTVVVPNQVIDVALAVHPPNRPVH